NARPYTSKARVSGWKLSSPIIAVRLPVLRCNTDGSRKLRAWALGRKPFAVGRRSRDGRALASDLQSFRLDSGAAAHGCFSPVHYRVFRLRFGGAGLRSALSVALSAFTLNRRALAAS